MYTEEDFLQLSSLQHFIFCKRQCALIHIEQAWSENVLTAEGRIMHEKAHEEHTENTAGIKIARGMPLHSFELGLSGKADIVEFYKLKENDNWVPFPVEYKHGKPKLNDSDKIQLCAQALCLEEMMKVRVSNGALFYGRTRRRLSVTFDDILRQKTKDSAIKLHNFIKEGKTPPPIYSNKCKSCSFINGCLPKTLSKNIPVNKYLLKEIKEL